MSAPSEESKGSSLLLRLVILILVGLGVATLVRKWAMSKTDEEFEARLKAADSGRP